MTVPRPFGRALSASLLLVVAAVGTSCGSTKPSSAATGGAKPPVAQSGAARSSAPRKLLVPKTSSVQDGRYFTDLAKADPGLATYVQADGNVALRALLTDGSAFCAFLQGGGGIDNAMAAVVIGAKSVEPQTHLPSTMTTFNAIDAVSLLTLCPGDQKLVPVADRSRIQALGKALSSEAS